MEIRRVSEVDLTDRRALLEAIGERLAQELDGLAGHRRSCDCKCGVPPDARTVPTLARELRELIRELDSLPGGKEVDAVDDLTARRKARLADAAGQ